MKTEFYFSILSENTIDLSPCFMLHFPDRVILINAPEGIQRYLLEKNIKRSKLCDIIFLDNEYDSIFGIWGMFLSFPEIEGNVINFHTNESVNRLINILNKEKFVSKSKFHEIIYSENNYLNLTEISEPISQHNAQNKKQNIPSPRKLTHNKFPITIEKLLFKIIKNKKLKQFFLFEITIIKVKNKRGAFDNDKATELGIEGKDRRALTSGNPVFSPKLNREVLPLEVVGNFKQGSLFVFIKETKNPISSFKKYKTTTTETFGKDIIDECNTLNVIEKANSCPNKKLDKNVPVNVFWLLKNKFDYILYSNFKDSIKERLKESEYFEKFFFTNNNDKSEYCLEEYIEYQRHRLNFINLFKNEVYDFELIKDNYKYAKEQRMALWRLPLTNNEHDDNEYDDNARNIKKIKITNTNDNDNDDNLIEVNFLGTCCAIPTLYRTFSSTLIKLHDHTILLDSGESTVSQLHYKFSREQRQSILSNISFIFISHTHADHFSGLISVLRLIHEANKSKGSLNMVNKEITLIVPPKIEIWCKELLDYFKYQKIRKELNLNFVNSQGVDMLYGNHLHIKLFNVSHLPDSRGISIISMLCGRSKFVSLTYTGDTKLDDKLKSELKGVKAFVKDSSVKVLIVESTFENELKEEARLRNHCTTQDSIEIGTIIKSDHTILTHISARTKGGSLEQKEEEIKGKRKVYIASDLSTFIFN
eukprot:GAHX01001295.1.p1 GENE.GAHX01001295.1~~GAHX01001295.1.p1  ORF type:complete len:717 (-),score=153.84 GAHX01001295.1:249-2360(-)